jgi:hypothetical protein
MLATVYWYAALMTNISTEEDKNFKKLIKYKPHISANMQHCIRQYNSSRWQAVFPVSEYLTRK